MESFGNVNDQSFSDIWNSEKYIEFRDKIKKTKFLNIVKIVIKSINNNFFMKIIQIVYSGLGGNSSVAFSLVEGQLNKKYKNIFIFTGIEKSSKLIC